ncbi:hypothetical protein [Comamonas sp. JUb58]|uniref:hypothetical protein n=1 Tax=Comamonas sp. JUb58 TaxID=2485114 RepID=UPI00105FF743|nr:hypothetical protein [Comamonas sp. JUb58]
MLPISRIASVLLLTFGAVSASNAAKQCFQAGGPTVYGDVTATVTGCVNHSGRGFAPFGPFEAQSISERLTCTYTFNKPLLTSSVTVESQSHDQLALLTIATDAGPYTPAEGDVVTPIPGSLSRFAVVVSGAGYTGTNPASSGTMSLKNNPPEAIRSISVTQTGVGSSPTVIRVCADDAGVPTPVVRESVPVPTLSEWNVLLTACLLGVGGLFAFWRSKRNSHQAQA